MKLFIFNFIIILFFSLNTFSQTTTDEINEAISNGNILKATELAEKNSISNPKDLNSWILLAKIYQKSYKYNEAIIALKKAISIDSKNISIQLELANIYGKIDNETAAIFEYDNILKQDSNNFTALINLSQIQLELKQYSNAYSNFEKLHKLDSLNSEFVRYMAICKLKEDSLLEAVHLFEKSYKINSTNLKTIYWLSDIYTNQKKYDTANVIINLAIENYPTNGKLYEKRANVNFKKNHHYRTIPDFKKAIELGYDNYQIRKNLAKSLYVTKQYQEANDLLESLIIKDTIDYQLCMYLGDIKTELKDYEKSLLFYNKALEILHPDPILLSAIYNGISENYSKQKLFYKQIEYIHKRQKVIPKSFNSNEYLLKVANIYENDIKDIKNALKYYERYWSYIKDVSWHEDVYKEQIISKINRLKEELHFQK
ncbi:MAG: hypothetical protein JXR51_00070 [Bacteroidales bacterium]|nr:hypothetical protein [Bacteroidales bacterium]MBN2755535.1 hypothetical protein [Bacteroidales bacterium]